METYTKEQLIAGQTAYNKDVKENPDAYLDNEDSAKMDPTEAAILQIEALIDFIEKP